MTDKQSLAIIGRLQKSLKKKETLVWATTRLRKCTFLNSFKINLAELICVNSGKSEFASIYIFNWYEVLYLACSSIFQDLDFARAIGMTSCYFQYGPFTRQATMSSYKLIILSSMYRFCLKKKRKKWNLFELGCSCDLNKQHWNLERVYCLKQATKKKLSLFYQGIWIYSFIFAKSYFLLQAGNKEPVQGWYPHILG